MEFTLPDSPGWSAMHLVSGDWGNIAIIAKREYEVSGSSAAPRDDLDGFVLVDTVDGTAVDEADRPIIRCEAETALFKTRGDVFYLGRGTEVPDGNGGIIDTAEFKVNGTVRRRFTRTGVPAQTDPRNLFGYQSRLGRLNPPYDPETFDYASDGDELFWSARRGGSFQIPVTARNFEGSAAISVESVSPETEADVDAEVIVAFSMTIPTVTATPFVWEGGSNAPANWCRRAPETLRADTITVDGARVSVLWRGSLALSGTPAADLRRIDLKEAA
jgi:hypothetical protein